MAIATRSNESPSEKQARLVEQDLSSRQSWSDDWRAVERIRLGQRPKNGLYPNAPNWIDPIVDVNVARVTEIEHTSLFTPRYLAHFIPLSKEAAEFKRPLEVAFDHLLKITLKVGTTLNTLLDEKNQGGMSIAKQVMDFESYKRVFNRDEAVPTFVHMHPLNVVVPPETQHISDAVRITDIHQYPVNTFRKIAKQRGWGNAEKLIKALGAKDGNTGGSTRIHDAYKSKLILEENEIRIETIAVYETYYLDDKGKKKVVIYSVDKPEIILQEIDHKWATGPRAGEDKRWKHEQFRYEDRNEYYIDTRGIGHLLKDNQQAASQYLNIKGYHYDLASYPMLENDGSATNVGSFRPGPGETLPKGISFAQMPGIDPVFNFDADIERAKAAQRVGSTLGSESSINRGRDRKTAEEVKTERANSGLMSAGSLMRFTRPLSSIFSNMWEEIQANPISLPIISDTGEVFGEIPKEAFSAPFIVVSSANSRNSDPDFINSQLGPLLQLLQNYPAIDSTPIVRRFLSNIDPDLSDEAASAAEEGGPLVQQVEQLTQAIQQLAGENEQMAERIAALMEIAEVNIQTDKEQDEDIQRLEKARTEVTQLVKDEVEKLKPESE